MWPRSLTVSVSLLFSFTFLIYVLFSSTVAPPSLESLPAASASASASTLPVASMSIQEEKEEEEERKATPVHETRRANEDRLEGRRVRFLSMSDEENERGGSSSSWWWMDEKEEMIREVLMSSGRGGRKKVDNSENEKEKEVEEEKEEEEEYIAIPRSAFVEMYRRVRAMDTVAKSLRVPDNKKNAFAVDSSIPVSLVGVQPRRLIMARSGQFQYQESSRLERNTIRVMHALYSRFCESKSEHQSDSLVLDMGANDAYYAFLSASYGCRVRSLEPQPGCLEPMAISIALNKVKHPIDFRNSLAHKDTNVRFPVTWSTKCHGSRQFKDKIDGSSSSSILSDRSDYFISPTRITDLANGERVLLWHIDVEGAEVSVLESGREIIENNLVDNLIIEILPDRWSGQNISLEEGKNTLFSLLVNRGYTCLNLDGDEKKKFLPTYSFPTSVDKYPKMWLEVWCTRNSRDEMKLDLPNFLGLF